jgi:hypothetical protein
MVVSGFMKSSFRKDAVRYWRNDRGNRASWERISIYFMEKSDLRQGRFE